MTLDADWARFTEPDYDEACSRLRRWPLVPAALRDRREEAWEPRPDAWTLREIAEHVAGVTYYAEQVGTLS